MSYYAKSSSKPATKFQFIKYGGWLPFHPEIHTRFIANHVKLAKKAVLQRGPTLHQEVEDFKKAIEGDKTMKDLFDQIFLQVSDKNTVPDFETLICLLDIILKSAPPYYIAEDGEGKPIGEPIGVPIYLIFDLLSNTAAAYDLFRMPQFNVAMKNLLNSWGKYLSDPEKDSNAVLNTGPEGWFSEAAVKNLETHLRHLTFNQTYITPKPDAGNRGYETWDDFFTRKFQKGARPIRVYGSQGPISESMPTPIYSACESTVYRIAYDVREHDQFWLKDQKYSLYDMLNRNKEMTEYFNGGTVYQAFLSPLDYHRWHSPVKGVIEDFKVVDGTYYAVLPDEGAPIDDPDLPAGSPYGAIIRSQSFITLTATRAIIYIKADDPQIGRVCFIGVGMVEVSTCDVTVEVGQQVVPGQELGMFHFGGSTHTLIFGPDCNVAFVSEASVNEHVWVNSTIGFVSPDSERKKARARYA